jgi:hypothetical protein
MGGDLSRRKSHPPFEPGNQVAATHGAYSIIRLEPRADQIAADLREIVPARSESDEPTIRLLALSLAQIEAATLYVAERGLVDRKGRPQPILRHLSTVTNTAARLCDRLGLTPTSRAQLGLDLARTEDTLAQHLDRGRRIREQAEPAA